MNQNSKDSKENGSHTHLWECSSIYSLLQKYYLMMVKLFFLSFIRTVTFFTYLGWFATGLLLYPKAVDLLSGPLSLIGLWLLLYNFDLVIQAAKR